MSNTKTDPNNKLYDDIIGYKYDKSRIGLNCKQRIRIFFKCPWLVVIPSYVMTAKGPLNTMVGFLMLLQIQMIWGRSQREWHKKGTRRSILSEINKSKEQEITSLFNDAKDEIEKINQHADEKKKDIVVRLAKNLEGKIPKETICMKIVKELDGKVSDTLIRDCLAEEYKQGYRRENAKKKNKRKEPTLAPLVVLNPQKYKEVDEEEEKQENREVVMIIWNSPFRYRITYSIK